MTTMIVPFTSQEAWLAERAKDVTSTESAALFGLSPYMTQFELWHRKKTGTVPAFTQNARMSWGNHLEAGIAAGIAEEHGWHVSPLKDYMRDPDQRIGASFDFAILNHPSGDPAHLEIKNVDYLAFKDGWIEHDDGTLEAPPHIELQIQHQMLVSGFPRAFIGVLVGGNRGYVIERLRDEAIIASLRHKIAAFWRSIEAGDEPAPVMPDDAAAVIALHNQADPGSLLDASDDVEIALLCAAYRDASIAAKAAEAAKQVAHAELLMKIGTAEKALTQGFRISASVIADSPGTLITEEMVGSHIGARRGYRRLTVTPTKGKP